MQLGTVVDLKADLRGIANQHSVGLSGAPAVAKVAGQTMPLPRSLGIVLGIAPGHGGQDFRVAVRTTRMDAAVNQYVSTLGLLTSGEIDHQHVGDIMAAPPIAASAHARRQRTRPLAPGSSIGHVNATAGTLGAFVQRDGAVHVLSNNHVLALSAGVTNTANHNDPIVQPGTHDGGAHPRDSVARLSGWVPLQAGVNYVDAALGILDYNASYDTKYAGESVTGLGQPAIGSAVWKIGRTTDVTHGKITAVALDDVPVRYGGQTLYFDDQLEIEGTDRLFSEPGDSGSLVVGNDCTALGLLFAGSTARAKTFANPIGAVLQLVGGSLLL